MKIIKICCVLGLVHLMISCSRDNFDMGPVETFPDHEPEVIIDSSIVSFYFRSASGDTTVSDGAGEVDLESPGNYLLSVVIKVDEGLQPLILAWETPTLEPGLYEGTIFSLLRQEDPDIWINSGPLLGGQFWVDLDLLGGVGELMSGTFYGTGTETGVAEEVEFEGVFNVIRNK